MGYSNAEKISKSNRPILSICIPTYNRCGYLYFVLKSIVEQNIFQTTNGVEIIVSDNFSSDLTEKITKIFSDKFPDKIKYHKNETNIGDLNFEKILTLAGGEVLKLHNDNFSFENGALDTVINKIKELRDEKPTIFFANGNSPLKKNTMCNNLTEFVAAASYLTTWIAAFSIWKDDFDKFKDFTQNVDTNLMQTDVLFRLSASGEKIFVFNELVFDGEGVLKKGGYNIAKIFGQNYLSLLKPYVESGKLDKQVYEKEKKVLLLNHIIPMRFTSSIREKGWKFPSDGYGKYLLKNYWHNLYFYTSIVKIVRLLIDAEVNLCSRKLNKNSYQKYWRKRNRHNETTISENTDATRVFVGKNVKGNIDVDFSANPNDTLILENNVTIGERVKFKFDAEELIIIKDGTKIADNAVVSNNMNL